MRVLLLSINKNNLICLNFAIGGYLFSQTDQYKQSKGNNK